MIDNLGLPKDLFSEGFIGQEKINGSEPSVLPEDAIRFAALMDSSISPSMSPEKAVMADTLPEMGEDNAKGGIPDRASCAEMGGLFSLIADAHFSPMALKESGDGGDRVGEHSAAFQTGIPSLANADTPVSDGVGAGMSGGFHTAEVSANHQSNPLSTGMTSIEDSSLSGKTEDRGTAEKVEILDGDREVGSPEKESYAPDRAAQLLGQGFIPISADRSFSISVADTVLSNGVTGENSERIALAEAMREIADRIYTRISETGNAEVHIHFDAAVLPDTEVTVGWVDGTLEVAFISKDSTAQVRLEEGLDMLGERLVALTGGGAVHIIVAGEGMAEISAGFSGLENNVVSSESFMTMVSESKGKGGKGDGKR